MSEKIQISMVSDIACPWCYVGKHRLAKALELCPEIDVQLDWKPFQLNPDVPREGRNRREYYLNKFGADVYTEILKALTGPRNRSSTAPGSRL